MKYGYIHYWWVETALGHGPFIKTTFSSRRHAANRLQAYDKENGWPVSRMKTVRVCLPELPKRIKK